MEIPEPPDPQGRYDAHLSGLTPCDPGPGLPLVTVIIAAYNAEDYIHYAIESVLNSQGVSVEIIVIDDCSSDRTVEVVERYKSGYNQVNLLRRDQKGGPSAARNDGLRQASGDWIAILDADDEFLPGRLSKLIAYGKSVDAEAVADNLQLFCFEGRVSEGVAFPSSWSSEHPLTLETLIKRDFPGSQIFWRSLGLCKPVFLRRSLLEREIYYDEDISMAEDLLFYSRFIAAGGRFFLIDDALYRYALRQSSLSQLEAPSADSFDLLGKLLLVNERIHHLSETKSMRHLLERRKKALWYEQCAMSLKQQRFIAAFHAAWHAGALIVSRRMLDRLVTKIRYNLLGESKRFGPVSRP